MTKPVVYCGCDPGAHTALVGVKDGVFVWGYGQIQGSYLARIEFLQLLISKFGTRTEAAYPGENTLVWTIGKAWIGKYRGAGLKLSATTSATRMAIVQSGGEDTEEMGDSVARKVVTGYGGCDKDKICDFLWSQYWPGIPRLKNGAINTHVADAAIFALARASREGVNIWDWKVK